MMKQVMVIESLNVRMVERGSRSEIPRYVMSQNIAPIANSEDVVVNPKAVVHEITMPIIEMFSYHKHSGERSETLIAITPEVEELLNVPVNTIWKELIMCRKEIDRLNDRHNKVLSMNFWGRLRFAFTGVLTT